MLHEPVTIHSVEDLLSFGPDLGLLNERTSTDECHSVLLLLLSSARSTATLSVNVVHQVILELEGDQVRLLQVQNDSVKQFFLVRVAHQHRLNSAEPLQKHVEGKNAAHQPRPLLHAVVNQRHEPVAGLSLHQLVGLEGQSEVFVREELKHEPNVQGGLDQQDVRAGRLRIHILPTGSQGLMVTLRALSRNWPESRV